jgi:hypothetical protein
VAIRAAVSHSKIEGISCSGCKGESTYYVCWLFLLLLWESSQASFVTTQGGIIVKAALKPDEEIYFCLSP